MRSTVLSLALLACGAAAAPHPKGTVCEVPYSKGKADDTPGLMQVLADPKCTRDATIFFKQGRTYNIWTPVVFPELNNVVVSIQGNIDMPSNVTYVQSQVAKSGFAGHWFVMNKGSDIIIQGNENNKNQGWFDAHGQQWWDAMNQVNRPHFFAVGASNVELKHLKLRDPIAWAYKISGKNIHIHDNTIFAESKTKSFPFNTDGFGISGENIVAENNHITNGDDCITVTSGAKNVYSADNYCKGGHGASLGSFGKGGSVAKASNITFTRFKMVDSLYGARFKSWRGGNGAVTDVHFSDFELDNIIYPIFITSNYWDQGLGSAPTTTAPNNTRIANFTFDNFRGTINTKTHDEEGSCISDPCWYYVPGETKREAIILDIASGFASGISTSGIDLRTDTRQAPTVMCDPKAVQETDKQLGFKCQNGPFVAV